MTAPNLFVTRVVRTERLTDHLIRVVLTGDRIAEFPDNGFTDRYVKLVFPPPGVRYDQDTEVWSLPPEERPTFRTYTIRHIDTDRHELWIDFVTHGDSGVAGPWAAGARPGDELLMTGPGGAYSPAASAGFHLLVGDEAAFPAIASALEAMATDATGVVVVEADDDSEHLDFEVPAGVEVRRVHRSEGGGDRALLDAVASLDLPPAGVEAFVHGELHLVRAIGRHLRDERGIPVETMSISGYWRRGKNEDGFQAEKRELAAADRGD